MTRSRSIAVAQSTPVAGDVEANLDEHARLARLAVSEGATLVVFPELSLTGYELALAAGLVFSEKDKARLCPLLDLAANHEVTLVVGAVHHGLSRQRIAVLSAGERGKLGK